MKSDSMFVIVVLLLLSCACTSHSPEEHDNSSPIDSTTLFNDSTAAAYHLIPSNNVGE